MITAVTKKTINFGDIIIYEGVECEVEKVWMDISVNDILVLADFGGILITTSIRNIELINQDESIN